MKRMLLFNMLMFGLMAGLVFGGTITVISPNGGEEWEIGTTKLIKWNINNISNQLRIVLFKEGQTTRYVIAKGLSSTTTSYQWKVGDCLNGQIEPGPGYKIKVREHIDGPNIQDDSNDTFTIVKKKTSFRPGLVFSVMKITVTSPDKNSKWETGKSFLIKWNWPGSGALKVQLYNYNGKTFLRDIGKSSTGSLNWLIPQDVYKWPGNYTIRVSTLDNKTEAFSDMFHISTQATTSKYTVNGQTNNKYKYKTKRKKEFTMQCQIDEDPGPGKMRVGYRSSTTDHTDCATIYRSFVSLNTSSFAGKGLLLKAKLNFNKFMGDNCNVKVYVLTQPWNGDAEALFSVKADYWSNPSDFTGAVQKWLAYPNSNYGIVFVGPNESMAYVNSKCVAYFDNVKLELEFLQQAK
jgi:hypothetical protein